MLSSDDRPSVCLSVPSIDSSSGGRQVAAKRLAGKRYRSIAAGAAYQPLIDICCRRRRSAANAGSVVLRAEGRGSQHRLVNVFTARCYASAVLAMALCLFVRLSVCPSVRHKSEFY